MSRRLRRRILIHKVDTLGEYISILKINGPQVTELYNDLLGERDSESSNKAIDSVEKPIFFLKSDFTISIANQSFLKTFQTKAIYLVGENIFEIENGAWEDPVLKALLKDVTQQNAKISDYEMERLFANVGRLKVLLNARRVQRAGSSHVMVVLETLAANE